MTANFPRSGTANPASGTATLALASGVSSGVSSLAINGPFLPAGLTGYCYAVVSAFSTNAELITINAASSTKTSLALVNALAQSHNGGDLVLPVKNGIIPVGFFGIMPSSGGGNMSTNGTQLQALINQLEAVSGASFVTQFDVGLYGFVQGVTITSGNVRIRGCGNAAAGGALASTELWLNADPGGAFIDLKMSAGTLPGVGLEGFSLVGSRSPRVLGGAPQNNSTDGLHARTNITVKDVGISGFNNGIHADFIDHTYWEKVNVTSCKYGMYVDRVADNGEKINGPPGGNVRFEKCEIKDNGIADVAFSPAAGTLVSTVFADCHFGYSPCVFYAEPDATFTYSAVGDVNTTLSGAAPTFPASTINVVSTTGFASSGVLTVVGVAGPITYTGKTSTTFTGCTGGTGTPSAGAAVYSAAIGQAGGLNAVVFDSTSFEQVGNRIMVAGPNVSTLQMGITNQGWGGIQATGGNGGNAWSGSTTLTGTAPAFPAATVNVTSTANFQSSGQLTIAGVSGIVSYTGISGNSFTGCTGGTGTPSNGAAVTQGLATLGEDTTMIQAKALIFDGNVDPGAYNGPNGDLFRITDLYNSLGRVDLHNGLGTMQANGNRLVRFNGSAPFGGSPSGLFPQLELVCHDRDNWKGRGYFVITTGTVTLYDLLELTSDGHAQRWQTSGAAPLGAAMEASNSDTVSVSAMASVGVARINSASNVISRGSYVKGDTVNPGCVLAATGPTDGAVVGQAINAASSGTVLVRLTIA